MKYKDYSPDIWKKIKAATSAAKSIHPQPVAAFDADGTLWDTDLGETFFDFQIDNKLVPLPEDPWQYYLDLKTVSRPQAYLWLAQICRGQSLNIVRSWAKNSIITHNPPIFEAQKNLIEYFLSEGVKIYIVTASIKWAVEPGAELVGLTSDHVIGVETAVRDGIITDEQKGEITYREGKVKALEMKCGGKPFFASGNSEGDQELLSSATHLSLAVSATRQDDKLYKTEAMLLKLAQQKGWLTHRFVDDGQ